MPERGPEHPGLPEWQELEVLLQGSGRPRPLPAALRARLEEALLARPAVEGDAVVAGPPGVSHGHAPLLARGAEGAHPVAGAGAPAPGTGAGVAAGGAGVAAGGAGVAAGGAGVAAGGAGVAAGGAGVAAGGAGVPIDLPAGARSKLQERLLARRRRRKWEGLAVLGAAAAAVAVVVAALTPGPARPPLAAGAHSSPVAAPAVRTPRFGTAGHAYRAPAAKAAAGAPVATKVPQTKTGAASAASGSSGAVPVPAVSVPAVPVPAVPVPAVSAVSPTKGPTAGRNWVTVRGKDLGKALAVYFGDTRALRLAPVSAGELRALTPPHAPGTVAVSVVSSAGRSKPAAGARYTFGTTRS